MIKIFFDLDGTVYDFYNIDGWLEKVRETEDETVFAIGERTLDYSKEIEQKCELLASKGVQFGVITWLPAFASEDFEKRCTEVKREWVKANMPFVTEFYALSYGIPKQYASFKRSEKMYLIDDNKEVGKMWETAIQRKHLFPFELTTLLDKLIG